MQGNLIIECGNPRRGIRKCERKEWISSKRGRRKKRKGGKSCFCEMPKQTAIISSIPEGRLPALKKTNGDRGSPKEKDVVPKKKNRAFKNLVTAKIVIHH